MSTVKDYAPSEYDASHVFGMFHDLLHICAALETGRQGGQHLVILPDASLFQGIFPTELFSLRLETSLGRGKVALTCRTIIDVMSDSIASCLPI